MRVYRNQKKNREIRAYSFFRLFPWLFSFVILAFYLIIGQMIHFYLPCPFYAITHFYCPGCGITRMFVYLLKFDFINAFRSNMLVFLCIPLLILYFIFEIREIYKNKKNPMKDKNFNKYWYTLIVISILFGILRNIPMFSFLAP